MGLSDQAIETLGVAAHLSQNNATFLEYVWGRQVALEDKTGASDSAKRLLQINPENSYHYFQGMQRFYSPDEFIKHVLPRQSAANSAGTNASYLTRLIDGAVIDKNGDAFKRFWRSLNREDQDYVTQSRYLFLHYHNFARSNDFDSIYDISISSKSNNLFRSGSSTIPFRMANSDTPFCWILEQHPNSEWQIAEKSISIKSSFNASTHWQNLTCFLPAFLLTPGTVNIEALWSGTQIPQAASATIRIDPKYTNSSKKKGRGLFLRKWGSWQNEKIELNVSADIDLLGFNIFISPPQPSKLDRSGRSNELVLGQFKVSLLSN